MIVVVTWELEIVLEIILEFTMEDSYSLLNVSHLIRIMELF